MFGYKSHAALVKGLVIGIFVGLVAGSAGTLFCETDKFDDFMRYAKKGMKRGRAMMRAH